MGVVYRATRETDGTVVALKLLKEQFSSDDAYQRRFVHEARAAREVRHRHLVSLLDAGEIEGRFFLAAEYVDGRTLEDRIKTDGPLPLEDLLRIAGEVATGMDALHERGVVHRDVKSSNIMLDQHGRALLTDFGLAKGEGYTGLTKPGQVIGTLDYLAPELIEGAAATPASDVYALACVVFECIAGRPPFAHKSVFQIGYAHLTETPPDPSAGRPDMPAALSVAVLVALSKQPSERPQSAGVFAHRLRRAADS